MKRHTVFLPMLAALIAVAPGNARSASEAERVTAAVENTLRKHAPDAHRCFEQALADRLDVAGIVELEVTVGAGGQIKKSTVVSRGDKIPETMATCVSRRALTWKIADIETGASVVLPLSFAGEMNQYVVRLEDAPARGPAGSGKRAGPFQIKVLADPVNMHTRQLSAVLLTVSPASRVAMHRHPQSDKAIYVRKGKVRILGPKGFAALSLAEGTAVFIPRGFPHVIENMGRQLPVQILQIFTPPGPEVVYRDPANPAGRAAFEVVRDANVPLPPGPVPAVIAVAEDRTHMANEGKVKVQLLLNKETTGSDAMALELIELAANSDFPKHTHDGSAEFMYVVKGSGTLFIGNEPYPYSADQVLHIPSGQLHGGRTGPEPVIGIQIYAPAGPEQRFKSGALPKKP